MNRQQIRKLLVIISFILFPITIFYFSPYLIIMGAFEGVVAGSMLVFGAMFVLSIFFGRLFCGWLCPGGGAQEICSTINDKPFKGGFRKWIKFAIWVPWMAIIVLAVINANGLKSVDAFYQTWHGISVAKPGAYIIFYGVISLFVGAVVISGRRAFCHSLCWMAPFMIIGNKFGKLLQLPQVKIKANPERCISCHKCTNVCQMSLPVESYVKLKAVESTDCILCGACVDTCPKDALCFSVNRIQK